MSNGPTKSRYDTNPLPKPEEVGLSDVDTEAPTRPMPQQEQPPRAVDTSPYATRASAETQAAYMPPGTNAPLAAPRHFVATQQQPGQSVTAQLGLQQNFAAMACYTPFFGLVAAVLLTMLEPAEHRFLRFHAKQAIFAHASFWVVAFAFSMARAAIPFPVNLLVLLPQVLFFFVAIGGFVYLMIKAYRWKVVKIPVIGDQVE
jgi:uncharacterized membrane protein